MLSPPTRTMVALSMIGMVIPLLIAGNAHSQLTASQMRLSSLQQQNAYQQQQIAIQNAVQQTNLLLHTALREDAAPQQSGFYQPLNFQQQSAALQAALQQTTLLQQSILRSYSGPSRTSLLQINALQSTLQLSNSLQTQAQLQDGQLTPTQIQVLFREQVNLMGLLALPPPMASRRTQGR